MRPTAAMMTRMKNFSAVIPGPAEGRSPESISPAFQYHHHRGCGFRTAASRLPDDAGSASLARPCRRPAARPHLLELIEGAHLRPEHMDDHVAGVDQHPV